MNVSKVTITNRRDRDGELLANVRVEIDDILFGTLPQITETGKSYDIPPLNGTAMRGSSIKILTTGDTCLQISDIRVYGFPVDQN